MSDTAALWRREIIADHACEIYRPPQTHPQGVALLYLHDMPPAGLPARAAWTGQSAARGLPVVAPQTGRSWWTDRLCPAFDAQQSAERYLLDGLLPWLRDHWGLRPPQLGLWGIGMGGQAALRLAYKHPRVFPVVAAVAPAIDYHTLLDDDPLLEQIYGNREAARQDTATLHIHPLNWPRHQFFCCDPADAQWWDGCDRLHMKLASLGVPHSCDLETSTAGDRPAYAARMAERTVTFLADRLEQVARAGGIEGARGK